MGKKQANPDPPAITLRTNGTQFPVLASTRRNDPTLPATVPWSALSAGQALRNHQQTLTVLASRGGLSPWEIYANVHGLGLWSDRPDDRVAVDCSGSWTHYKPRRFMAGSIRRCVLEALAAKALS